jgi:hypothetical protein
MKATSMKETEKRLTVETSKTFENKKIVIKI